jgi:hypothetical protein
MEPPANDSTWIWNKIQAHKKITAWLIAMAEVMTEFYRDELFDLRAFRDTPLAKNKWSD